MLKIKRFVKLRTIVIIQGNTLYNISNLKYSIPKEASCHNGSKYDHHFIIKELAENNLLV